MFPVKVLSGGRFQDLINWQNALFRIGIIITMKANSLRVIIFLLNKEIIFFDVQIDDKN